MRGIGREGDVLQAEMARAVDEHGATSPQTAAPRISASAANAPLRRTPGDRQVLQGHVATLDEERPVSARAVDRVTITHDGDGRVTLDRQDLLAHRDVASDVERVAGIGIVVDRLNGVVEIGRTADRNCGLPKRGRYGRKRNDRRTQAKQPARENARCVPERATRHWTGIREFEKCAWRVLARGR